MLESIGKYKLDSIIGRGAMGLVYKAKDPDIERFVAIKVLNLNSKSIKFTKEHAFEAFKREAKAVGALLHPNIVSIFEVNFDQDPPYLVMQYVEGIPLSKLIAQKKMLEVEDILSIAEQVGAALDYAHSKGIFHRDIKPANILYTAEKKPYILDFGVASIGALQKTKYIVGTIGYMAPEQMLNLAINGAADQFSLAVTVYELFTGKRPFFGTEIKEVLSEVSQERYQPLTEVRPDLPIEVDLTLKRALQYDPAKRFVSCTDFSKQLRNNFTATYNNGFTSAKGKNESAIDISRILEEERRKLLEELGLEIPKKPQNILPLLFAAVSLILIPVVFIFLNYAVRVESVKSLPPIPQIEFEYDLYQKSNDELIQLISNPSSSSETVILAIKEALHRRPVDLVKALAVASNNPNVEIKLEAIRALGVINTYETENILLYKLTDPDAKVRLETIQVLTNIKAKKAKDFLTYLAKHDPNNSVRNKAVEAIELLK